LIPVSGHWVREHNVFILPICQCIGFATLFKNKPNGGDHTDEKQETSDRAACDDGDIA